MFFIWLIYNAIKEHYIYKANFISTKTEIIFKSILYKKEIKWTEVINIKMDIMMPVSSYLPYNETRCIVLELRNGDKHKILNGGYKNIDDFKVYLKNNFSGKIII